MESGHPIVVAMKGSRYSGKTTIANGIAESLKCTLISLDDILDDLTELHVGSLDYKTQLDPEVAQKLFNRGYAVACRMAITQLRLGQSVVIDSPLDSFSHLKPVFDSHYSYRGDAFVIVECQLYDYGLKEKLDHRDEKGDRWYKPRSWDDFASAIDNEEDSNIPGVSRLEVGVFDYAGYVKVVKALRDLAYCSKGHVVELDEWEPFHYNETNEEHHHVICDQKRLFAMTKEMGGQPYSNATHALTDFNQAMDGAYCWACQKPASGAAYTCRCGCRVVLHKECQKLSEDEAHHKTPKSLIELLRLRLLGGYTFPNPRRCKLCRATQREFSYECQTCVFQTHLRWGYTPTLCSSGLIQARPIPGLYSYRCEACGKLGSYAGYSCFRCNKHYHVGCVFMPLTVPHEHGGWKHQMDLKFKSAEDEEGTFCDFCYKDLDPNYWFYECEEGCYLTHIECVFSERYDEEGQECINGNEPPEVLKKQYEHFCNGDHEIIYHSYGYEDPEGESLEEVLSCWACEKPLSGDVYTCGRCSLALHVSCAVKFDKDKLKDGTLSALVGYSFLEDHRCSICTEYPLKYISYECGKCIFKANLKHKKWPAVIHHRGHEHHLSFWAMPLPQVGRFLCYPCDKPGSFISYDYEAHIHCVLA